MAVDQPVDLNQNASQLYASRKGWHARDSGRESISDPHIPTVHRLFTAEKGRQTSKVRAGMEFGGASALYSISLTERDVSEERGRAGSVFIEGAGCEYNGPCRSRDRYTLLFAASAKRRDGIKGEREIGSGMNRGIPADPISSNPVCEVVVRRGTMRGHIKLFTLQVDLKRGEQLRAAAGIEAGTSREARPTSELLHPHAP